MAAVDLKHLADLAEGNDDSVTVKVPVETLNKVIEEANRYRYLRNERTRVGWETITKSGKLPEGRYLDEAIDEAKAGPISAFESGNIRQPVSSSAWPDLNDSLYTWGNGFRVGDHTGWVDIKCLSHETTKQGWHLPSFLDRGVIAWSTQNLIIDGQKIKDPSRLEGPHWEYMSAYNGVRFWGGVMKELPEDEMSSGYVLARRRYVYWIARLLMCQEP